MEILFVDEDNVPVGKPVKFRDYIAPKYREDGTMQAAEYRFHREILMTPDFWKTGLPVSGLIMCGPYVRRNSLIVPLSARSIPWLIF
jgi:hypothetical protein